ncbi:MAG TPA: hypothetical protein VGN77_00025 [Steroidobacteraceae bacterium]|nr:hypothetical protein [Steroidobacteraceae bacterium]
MKNHRRPLLLLLLVFVAPLAFAFWLYYGSHWRPALRTNHGALIDPPIALPALPIGGGSANALTVKWSLLVVGAGESGCEASCRVALVYARQTWLSLGKLSPRVQRVLLAGESCCDRNYLRAEHQGLAVAQLPDSAVARVLALLPLPLDHTIFIVDPLGNLMMRYDVRQDPKGLREDLKNLLELSHIG